MSQQITEARVKQFSANVFHLSQQKGSRLRGYVRSETQKAKSAFYDRIGSVVATEAVGRHQDTQYSDTPHSRRRVTMKDFRHADLVDQEDKIRILMNPESEYSKAFMMAFGRAMDDVIISAALGTSYAGEEGATSVAFPDSQVIAGFDGTTTTGVGLNVETLRAVKKKFNQNEAGDSDLYFVLSAEQLDNLLGEVEVTSSDYAAVKALVQGDVDTFMGFKFIRSERLPVTAASTTYTVTNGVIGAGTGTLAAGARRCFAWQKEGLLLAIGADVKGRMTEMPNKNYAIQVFASMTIGATRLEEEKVVEIRCKE